MVLGSSIVTPLIEGWDVRIVDSEAINKLFALVANEWGDSLFVAQKLIFRAQQSRPYNTDTGVKVAGASRTLFVNIPLKQGRIGVLFVDAEYPRKIYFFSKGDVELQTLNLCIQELSHTLGLMALEPPPGNEDFLRGMGP